jgi:DNA-binding transcriptional ArsR family regulator
MNECYSVAMAAKAKLNLPPEGLDIVASRFRVLSESVRLRMLQVLQEGEKSVTELAEAVGTTQPNVSKHLKVLQEAGMVGRRQAGNTVYCFIADPTVFALCEVVCSSLRDQLAAQAKVFGLPRTRG